MPEMSSDDYGELQKALAKLQEVVDRINAAGMTREQAAEIIAHLNLRTGRNYPAVGKQAGGTVKMIRTRWGELGEDASVDEFKRVIDCKSSEWSGDEKTRVWIRPSTLFGPKFHEYRGQASLGSGKSQYQEWSE